MVVIGSKDVVIGVVRCWNEVLLTIRIESCNTFIIPKTNNWGWDNLDLSAVVDDLVDDTLQIHIEIEGVLL